jgi:uncharacterized protein
LESTCNVSSISKLEKVQAVASLKFQKFMQMHQSKMRCSKGCFSCCNTKLSIFAIEAVLILRWYQQLSLSAQTQLRKLLKSQENPKTACSFLTNGNCSIYSVRPTICRTQGMAILLPQPNTAKTDRTIDICPLNIEVQFDQQDSNNLDLEKLNTLQSALQTEMNTSYSLLSSAEKFLFEQRDANDRISLEQVAKIIINESFPLG